LCGFAVACFAGDLFAAVAANTLPGLQRLLAASHNNLKQQHTPQTNHLQQQQQQQQLNTALELAALLGQSRLPMAKLLLLHGADPCARSGAALSWAARRRRCSCGGSFPASTPSFLQAQGVLQTM
jgi:hypothetical protein